eukprot:4586980-Pyramimonas_sp.AAC.1
MPGVRTPAAARRMPRVCTSAAARMPRMCTSAGLRKCVCAPRVHIDCPTHVCTPAALRMPRVCTSAALRMPRVFGMVGSLRAMRGGRLLVGW